MNEIIRTRMKKSIHQLFHATAFSIVLWSCAGPKATSVIYGDQYDQQNNVTNITMLPYGGVTVPGKWTKTRFNNVSNQYFYTNVDSTTFAVVLNPWNSYEFVNPQTTPETFVKECYEWDANYLKQQHNAEIRIVKEGNQKNFIIWNIKNPNGLNDYFLFGLKGRIAYNLYIGSENWPEGDIIEFLEKAYR